MMWGGLWGNRTTPFPASSNRSAGLHEGWGPSEPVPLRCPGPWQPTPTGSRLVNGTKTELPVKFTALAIGGTLINSGTTNTATIA